MTDRHDTDRQDLPPAAQRALAAAEARRKAAAPLDLPVELGGRDAFKRARTPAIMADAAHAILSSGGRSISGRLLIDEDILREQGQSDFEQYRFDPASGPLVPDLFLD